MTEPYRPSNGSEGRDFQTSWCDHCARDAVFRETGYEGDPADGCPILAATMVYDIGDKEYPKEWISDERGPRCTTYAEDPACPVRCDHTDDLFPPC